MFTKIAILKSAQRVGGASGGIHDAHRVANEMPHRNLVSMGRLRETSPMIGPMITKVCGASRGLSHMKRSSHGTFHLRGRGVRRWRGNRGYCWAVFEGV